MLLRNIAIENFGSIKRASIDLDKFTGITIVEGVNGAGKSYVFIEAITWLLLGRTIRKIAADDIRREGSKTGTKVSGVLELDDGRTVVLERSRPGGFAFSFANALGTSQGNQETFENLLGIDYRLFTTSVVFGGAGISSFCSLSDRERKLVLERMLDTERFMRAKDRCRDSVSTTNENLRVAATNYTITAHLKKSLESDLAELEKKSDDFHKERAARIEQVSIEIETLKGLVDSCNERYERAVKASKKKRRKHERKKRAWESVMDVAKASAKRARELVADAFANRRLAQKEIEDAQDAVDRLKVDNLPEICPTCGTPRDRWPDPKRKHVAAEGPLRRLETAHVTLKRASQVHINARKNLDTCDTAVDKKLREQPEKPNKEDVYRLAAKADAAKDKLRTAKRNLKQLKRDNKNPFTKLLGKKAQDFSKAKRKLRVYKARHSRVAMDKEIVEYWVKSFPALAAMLLDEAGPLLTERARFYSENLMDGKIDIKFDPSSQKRGKTFVPIITNSDGGDSYEKASKGERARIDLCILMALRDLMESRLAGKFSQIFLDEVFDGLDDEGAERVVATLRKVFKGKSVFLITHNPALKGLADNVIVAEKIDGETILRGV